MPNELKPCPFCGGEARWATSTESADWEIQPIRGKAMQNEHIDRTDEYQRRGLGSGLPAGMGARTERRPSPLVPRVGRSAD